MISWAELGLLKELLEPTAGLEQRARTIFKLCDADASADIQEEELVRKLKQCNSMAVAVAKALVQSWAPEKPAKKNEQDLTPLHGPTHMRPVHSKRSTILYPRACTCPVPSRGLGLDFKPILSGNYPGTPVCRLGLRHAILPGAADGAHHVRPQHRSQHHRVLPFSVSTLHVSLSVTSALRPGVRANSSFTPCAGT